MMLGCPEAFLQMLRYELSGIGASFVHSDTIMTMVVADCKARRFSTCRLENATEETPPFGLSVGPDKVQGIVDQNEVMRVEESDYSFKTQ